AGWVYRALRGKNQTLACTLAAMSAPVVNTGIFALIMSTVLRTELEQVLGVSGGEVISVLFLTVIGVNFLVEFALNAILSAAIARVVQVVSKK
ncbi:MAG: ECF transporter S component, partial [Clostridiales bacterium]|nr:ECF transporter S component [Clostridiales bacterium]